jgi:hypothetical protein
MRAFALLLLLLPACHWERPPEKKPINSYLADARDLANVRRIMVLPFTEESGVGADKERVRKSFLTELQKLRRFEIVPLPAEAMEDDVLNETLREGRVSTAAMVMLCDRFHLDGVMTGIVTDWRPYMPQHLGLRTQLLSVHSGSPVWAVDALYDAADRATISDLKQYHQSFEADDGSLHAGDMPLIAPTRFATYVAHRVVGTWSDK